MCELTIDQRHEDADALAALRDEAPRRGAAAAEAEGAEVDFEPLWAIAPVPFDAALVAAAARPSPRCGGRAEPLPSGAAARRGRDGPRRRPDRDAVRPEPRRPQPHAAEDTDEAHLELAVRALAALAGAGRAGLSQRPSAIFTNAS